jgi:hypothetical protein
MCGGIEEPAMTKAEPCEPAKSASSAFSSSGGALRTGEIGQQRFLEQRRWRVADSCGNDAELVSKVQGETLDISGRQRESVIGARAEQAREAFERVEAAHGASASVRVTQPCQISRIPNTPRRPAQHIRIERQHHTRPIEEVPRVDSPSERELAAAQLVIPMQRIVLMPPQCRIPRAQRFDLRLQSRRTHGTCQQEQPIATLRIQLAQDLLAVEQKLLPRRDPPFVQQRLRPRRIPQLQDRCLREHVRGAEARGMQRIALDLRRPSLVRLDEHAHAVAAQARRRRIEQRLAGQRLLRRVHVRHDFF